MRSSIRVVFTHYGIDRGVNVIAVSIQSIENYSKVTIGAEA